MSDESKKPSRGAYLNGTYLLLGSIASLIAIATGIVELRGKKEDPAAVNPAGATQPPAIQIQGPPVPPFTPPTLPKPPPLPGQGEPGK